MTPRIITFFLGLSFILLVSCKDDDKSYPSVTGKWQGTLLTAEITVYGVTLPNKQTDDTFDAVVEFKSDGTAILTDDNQTSTGTWSQNNDKLTLSVTFGTEFIDLSGTYTIQEITDKKLTLYIEKDGSYTDPDTKVEVQGTVKATLNFDKKS
ncbi:hypothetical protein SAMN04488109_4118 [Chryseolinea serpens]|uniref:Lipocalin-like domain-containing protein n=1 Tax=Chryseolinea serpens TaxID=947013 RepID=A0A1M5TKL6_9BACT|nr:lipocalin family protein [Chryseolinea serpens]SHH50893.1 hypothetical protein SAMN04488109_4118 [Chryseolinea serpens]